MTTTTNTNFAGAGEAPIPDAGEAPIPDAGEDRNRVEAGRPAEPFKIRDCALIAMATGFRAQNLREFRDALSQVHRGSIYHHFWGRLLQPQFDEPEYNNDFAAWAFHGLHDKSLAERLAVVDPAEYDDLEELRLELIEIVEDRLDESEMVPWAQADQQFYFTRSQIVVLDTGLAAAEPVELARLMPRLSYGSVFYHFIDARRRTDTKSDDFSAWLAGFGTDYEDLSHQFLLIDPYFSSLKEIRRQLADLMAAYFEEVDFE